MVKCRNNECERGICCVECEKFGEKCTCIAFQEAPGYYSKISPIIMLDTCEDAIEEEEKNE